MYISAMLKGMQAGVSAVIVDVVIGLSGNVIRKKRFFYYYDDNCIYCGILFKVNVIIVILASGLIGMLMFLYRTRKGGMNHDLH